jgi:aspartate carbamoyltransferase catalytic subunit
MENNFKNKDIISITDFTRDEIIHLCKKAKEMYDFEKSKNRNCLIDSLRGKALASMFYEPSTRTKTSFNTAIRELGGTYDGFSGIEGTSVMKKETIRDTIAMMEANHFNVIVMRNKIDGSVQWAADVSQVPVINGGDGKNEHPTQALLDIFTLYLLNNENLDEISIGFGGDLAHGRTIKSLGLVLSHFKNVTIRWAAEDFLGMPSELTQLLKSRGVIVVREKSVEDVMSKVQFYYMTRPQLERMQNISQAEIMKMIAKYRIDLDKVKNYNVKLMHPLPVNSEIAEIDYKVYFDKCQSFFQQAENGIFLRKALLYLMLNNNEYIPFTDKLQPSLENGNNRFKRKIKETKEIKRKFIDNIANGIVIDHLNMGTEQIIIKNLNLTNKGFSSIPATLPQAGKSFIKTDLPELNERELKNIAIISPEPTVNLINEGKVTNKFIYLLCNNSNCITRTIIEDVPPKFYNDNEVIKCRYCRKPYKIQNKKISEEEKEEYLQLLPKNISPI